MNHKIPPGPDLLSTLSIRSITPLSDYQIIWIRDGTGIFEVDFQQYLFRGEELLFLTPGQYFRITEGELSTSSIVLTDFLHGKSPERDLLTRVLFSHVIAVGSIQLTSELSGLLSRILSDKDVSEEGSKKQTASLIEEFLRASVNAWLRQKPFDKEISNEEQDIIFDLKHLIDEHFWRRSELSYYNEQLNVAPHKLSQVTKSRLDRTPGELEKHRILLEAGRELIFSSKSAKEITYALGFNDPAYFNRFFRSSTGLTTLQFRDRYQNFKSEVFVNDLIELIDSHYREKKSVAFYAEKLNMTPQSLSAKVSKAIGKNVSEIITTKVAAEAKKLLVHSDMKISDIAFSLGFKEPSHFSHFFKNTTDRYPSQYRELQD